MQKNMKALVLILMVLTGAAPDSSAQPLWFNQAVSWFAKRVSDYTRTVHPDDSLRCLCAAQTPTDKDSICLLPRQPFFSYTPKGYRQLLEGEAFLSAWVALARRGNDYVLYLDIEVLSDKAGEYFGEVAKNTFLTLQFMRKKPVLGITYKGGAPQVRQGKTYYRIAYTLDAADARRLSRNELDHVRLHWTKGVQVFPVFDIEVLRRQLACWNIKTKTTSYQKTSR